MGNQGTDSRTVEVEGIAADGDSRPVYNEPAEFNGFVAIPEGRMFAVFEDPEAGERAVAELRRNGFAAEGDLWVLEGAEGIRRIDLTGAAHGIGGRIYRTLEHVMSDEWDYLAVLDEALRKGGVVLSIHVGDGDVERARHLLAGNGGRPLFAYRRHSFAPATS
ncbi:MAG: hypothetical protein M0013_14820 [Actinomycetota bacterium]|nr:hypothetical protein [Actinomycetota bacterium]